MAVKTTTGNSLRLLRSHGYRAEQVERWVHHIKRRFDFLGIADILAIIPDTKGVLAVQSCAASGLSAHVNNVCFDPDKSAALRDWLLSGNRFEIWAWGLRLKTDKAGTPLRNTDGSRTKRKVYTPAFRTLSYSNGQFYVTEESEISSF